MKKKILLTAILGLLLFIISYNYVYQEHRNIANEVAEYLIDSRILSDEFSIDPTSSESKYLNKTIQVSGIATNADELSIVLDYKVYCQLLSDVEKTVDLNSEITIKGRFIGYDDLLEQIKLDQCSIINKH